MDRRFAAQRRNQALMMRLTAEEYADIEVVMKARGLRARSDVLRIMGVEEARSEASRIRSIHAQEVN